MCAQINNGTGTVGEWLKGHLSEFPDPEDVVTACAKEMSCSRKRAVEKYGSITGVSFGVAKRAYIGGHPLLNQGGEDSMPETLSQAIDVEEFRRDFDIPGKIKEVLTILKMNKKVLYEPDLRAHIKAPSDKFARAVRLPEFQANRLQVKGGKVIWGSPADLAQIKKTIDVVIEGVR